MNFIKRFVDAWYLAGFMGKNKLTYRDVKDAVLMVEFCKQSPSYRSVMSEAIKFLRLYEKFFW